MASSLMTKKPRPRSRRKREKVWTNISQLLYNFDTWHRWDSFSDSGLLKVLLATASYTTDFMFGSSIELFWTRRKASRANKHEHPGPSQISRASSGGASRVSFSSQWLAMSFPDRHIFRHTTCQHYQRVSLPLYLSTSSYLLCSAYALFRFLRLRPWYGKPNFLHRSMLRR